LSTLKFTHGLVVLEFDSAPSKPRESWESRKVLNRVYFFEVDSVNWFYNLWHNWRRRKHCDSKTARRRAIQVCQIIKIVAFDVKPRDNRTASVD